MERHGLVTEPATGTEPWILGPNPILAMISNYRLYTQNQDSTFLAMEPELRQEEGALAGDSKHF